VASTLSIFIINICCGGDMENAKGNTKKEQKSQESLNSPTEIWYAFWDAMIRRDAKTAYDLLVVIKEHPFSYISYKEFSNLLNTVTEKDIER